MTNVLLIMADELSCAGVGALGGRAVTPNLDALARRGLVFDAAYTPSPICVPTRAAIATGRYLHEIGYWSSAEPYDGRVPGWGHRLQEAGVPVTSIGKLHYRRAADPTGFDTQIEPIHVVDGRGWLQALLRRPLPSYDATAELSEQIGPGMTDYTRFDSRVTDEACRWLGAAPDAPWVTFVSYLSPHYPLIAPDRYFGLYDPSDFESDEDPLPDHPILREIGAFFDHDAHFTPEARGIARAAYWGLCSFLDAQVGRVLEALEASGQAEDTLVIFTSDHGEMLGEKGFWTKSTMYEASARVPLFVAGRGVPAERRSAPVSLIDLAPTILNAAAVDASGLPGIDLTQEAVPERTVFSEYHDGGVSVGITMVRWGTWKYVHYAEGHRPQLFDLMSDPGETTDLAAVRPEIVAEARRRMSGAFDPEAVNARAHADQARKLAELGGREKVLAEPQWNFTPADSR